MSTMGQLKSSVMPYFRDPANLRTLFINYFTMVEETNWTIQSLQHY